MEHKSGDKTNPARKSEGRQEGKRIPPRKEMRPNSPPAGAVKSIPDFPPFF